MPGISVTKTCIPFNGVGGIDFVQYWSTLISATVENAAPTHVVLTFPAAAATVASDITATVNGVARTVSSASWTGAVWTVVLASAVLYGDVVVMTFVLSGGTVNVTNNVSEIAEASALVARFTAPPTDARKILINNLIINGIAHGWWNMADMFKIIAAHDEQASTLNWKENDHNSTYGGTYTFTADKGFKGNGVNGYCDLDFIPSTDGVNYTQNSASFGIGINTSNVQYGLAAGSGVIATGRCYLELGYGLAGYPNIGAINSGSYALNQYGCYERKGFSFLIRSAANNVYSCKNFGYSVSTDASGAVPTASLWLGGYNSGGTLTDKHTLEHSFAYIGGALTIAQYHDLIKDVNVYLAAVGCELLDTDLFVELSANPLVDILTGQSNASQQLSIAANLPVEYSGILEGKYIFDPYLNTLAKVHPTINTIDYPRSVASWGEELPMLKGTDAFSASPPTIIKGALGGQAIVAWNNATGTMWLNLICYVRNYLAYCTQKGITPTFRSLLWMQGESDCVGGTLGTYQTNLTNFINNFRAYNAALANIKIVLVKLSTTMTGLNAADITTINGIFDTVAGALSDVSVMDVDALGVASDGIHYNAASTILIGEQWSDMINV